jgi:hypothetical protein
VVDAVDVSQHRERLGDRQIPPQLGPLAEEHTDAGGDGHPVALGVEPVDAYGAGGRHKDAAEQLHRCGFTRAVRSDVRDGLPGLDRQVDVVDGDLVAVAPGE